MVCCIGVGAGGLSDDGDGVGDEEELRWRGRSMREEEDVEEE